MKKGILLSAFIFFFSTISIFAAVRTATTGNWSTTASSNTAFGGASVTVAADSIIIPNGVTVTVQSTSVTCGALIIQQGGTLAFASSSSRNVVVVSGSGYSGTVTIDGAVSMANSNSQFIQWNGPTFTLTSNASWSWAGTSSGTNGGIQYSGTTPTTITGADRTIGSLTITGAGTVNISGNINFRGQGTSYGCIVLAATSILNIPSGSTVTLSTNSSTSTDFVITSGGKINLDGILDNRSGATGTLAGAGTLNVNNGAKYIHNHTGVTLQGSVAGTVVWNTGSTCEIAGYTTGQTPTTSFNQTFSNFNWNCTGQSGTINIANMSGATVNGKFTLVSTNGQILRLNNNTSTFTLTTKDFEIQSGTLEFTGSSATSGTKEILIAGDFTQSGGTITESGTAPTQFTFNKSGTQVFSKSAGIISNTIDFVINNGSTLSLNSPLSVVGTVTVNSGGTLNTGNNLTLSSNASASGRIGNSAGAINGTVTVERYIPGGKRAFRFLGHPFSTALNLSALTDNILITGGSGTGFTSSTTNNPSAFWYNPSTGNESTTSDPGWTAFTTADGTSGAGNIWSQYEGIRVLVRGSIADGLSPVTPSPVTLDATGTLNTGTQTIAVTKGTNSGFNLISNPFASNINLTTAGGNITLGSNLVTNHYVWDISAGTKGGWVNTAFSSSYVLPSFSAFFVKTAANDNITITEAAKTSTAATGTLFRNTNASPQMVRLWVLGNNITWDKFELYYNKESVLENDKHDGVKMFNSEVNLYSLNNSGMYSIDSRPYVQDDVIPLGFTSAVQQTYTIKATDFNMPAGVELYLRDKFLGTETKLVEDAEYTFSVTNNPASQGNARFEIAQKAAPLQPVVTSFYVKLSPNPAKGMVKVSFSNEEVLNTQISIVNAEGKMVKQVNAGNVQAANLNINISDLAKGIYYVTLQNGKEKKTETLQVQ